MLRPPLLSTTIHIYGYLPERFVEAVYPECTCLLDDCLYTHILVPAALLVFCLATSLLLEYYNAPLYEFQLLTSS
jgi:hypothetical protein